MTIYIYYTIFEVIILGNQELKNRTPIGSAVDKKLYNQLKQYSLKTGIPISKLLDKAIELLLKSTKI